LVGKLAESEKKKTSPIRAPILEGGASSMLAMHNECQIAFANLVMTRIVSSLGESRSRAGMMATPANAAPIAPTPPRCSALTIPRQRALLH
jgi:hypothetical protein